MISNTKSVRTRTAAFFAALLLFSVLGHANPPSRSPSVGELSTIHIDNFGRVNSSYYRGAAPEDKEYASLAAFGIKTVIDLRGEDVELGDKLLVEQLGMKYLRLPMSTRRPPTPEMIETFLETVNDAANQPVYVHCVGGKHRTGVMTAVYRMSHEAWTADQAFKEMKRYRFGADFLHPEFKRFVYSYEPSRVAIVNASSAPERRSGS
jgi:protein tyrosine/serine phosphatase